MGTGEENWNVKRLENLECAGASMVWSIIEQDHSALPPVLSLVVQFLDQLLEEDSHHFGV